MKRVLKRSISMSTSVIISLSVYSPMGFAKSETHLKTYENYQKRASAVNPLSCQLNDDQFNQLNEGLLQLGFGSKHEGHWKDHAAIALDYLNKGKYYNSDMKDQSNNMNKLQLMRNVIAYDAVQGAKEIVLEIMKRTGGCLEYTEKTYLNLLTAFLSFKPWSLPTHPATKELFTSGIFSEEKLEKFSEEGLESKADAELEPKLRKLMEQQARGITEHFVNLTRLTNRATEVEYTDSANSKISDANSEVTLAKVFYPNVAKLVRLAYLDHQIGRTLWLGRAFLGATEILLANKGREFRNNFMARLRAKIARDERFKNFRLENILGKTWVLPNEQLSLGNSLKYAKEKLVDAKEKVYDVVSTLLNGTILEKKEIVAATKLPEAKEYKLETSPYEITFREIPISNMSYVLTRNVAIEGAVIPSGAIPSPSLVGLEKNKGLIGNYVGAVNFITAEDAKDYNKVTELRDKAFYRTLNDGYSHIGYAHLRTITVNENDPQEITMSWVIDNYPSPAADAETDIEGPYNSAGVRFIGLEQYYKISAHTHLMVATMDPVKFAQFALTQTSKIRSPEQLASSMNPDIENNPLDVRRVYQAIRPALDKTGKPIPNTQPIDKIKKDWVMEMTYEQFNKLHQLNTPSTNREWFEKVTEAAANKLTEFMYKGMTFVWITPNGQYYNGGAYCSFTGSLAFKLGTGLEIQEEADGWDNLVFKIRELYDNAVDAKENNCNGGTERSPLQYTVGLAQKAVEFFSDESSDDAYCSTMKDIADSQDIKNIKTLSTMPIVSPSGLPAQVFVPAANMYKVEAPFIPIQDRLESGFNDVKEIHEHEEHIKGVTEGINAILSEMNSSAELRSQVFRYPIQQIADSELQAKMVKDLGSIDFKVMYLDPAEIRGLTMDLVESTISKIGCSNGSMALVCGRESITSKKGQ